MTGSSSVAAGGRLPILIALFAILSGSAISELNLLAIRKSTVGRATLYRDELVFSPDQSNYLWPAISFANGTGWRIGEQHLGKGAAFARTPGYPILYYPLYRLLGEQASLRALKYVHLTLFGLSVYCLFQLVEDLTRSRRAAAVSSAIYSLLPIGVNFLYQAMTEAVVPSYMLFYVYTLVRSYRAREDRAALVLLAAAGFLLGALILTRPVTGIAGLLIPAFAVARNARRGVRACCAALAVGLAFPLLMVGAWTYRNYRICACFVPLEGRYPDMLALWYSPAFYSLQDFTKCWGGNTEINHYVSPLFDAAIIGDIRPSYLEASLAAWPPAVIREFGRERLLEAIRAYQLSVFAKKDYFGRRPLPDDYLPEEMRAKQIFDELVRECRSRHPFEYWLVNSLKYLKAMVLHSNTSTLYFFQEEYRSHLALNLIRQALVSVHVAIYAALPLSALLLWRGSWNDRLVAYATYVIVPFAFVLFFIVHFRSIEQRYMLPILPVMYVGLANAVTALARRVKDHLPERREAHQDA